MRGQGPGGTGQSGPVYECGAFQKLNGIPENYTGEIYYDRFGNTYTEDEIGDLWNNVSAECTAGVFKLEFSGDYTEDEKDQVCKAFEYLSGQIGGIGSGIVPLKIEFVPGLKGGGASAFMEAECGLFKNYALVNIRTQKNQLPPNGFAGKIELGQSNSSFKWYTGPLPSSLNEWNTNPNMIDRVDLFTAALHEGLHVLGIASTYGSGNGVFTDWDRHLRKKNSNNTFTPLIIDANDNSCCSKHVKNPAVTPTYPNNCTGEIFFWDFLPFGEVSYNFGQPNVDNWLCHLDIACSSNPNDPNKQYVMHPTLGASPHNPANGNFSFPRRELTNDEKTILCKIGYESICNGCNVVVANDDHFPVILFLESSPSTNPLQIQTGMGNISPSGFGPPLIANDVVNPILVFPGNIPIYEMQLCGSDPELTVVPILDNGGKKIARFDVSSNTNVPGVYKFCYRLTGCNNSCDEAYVYITIMNKPIPTACTNQSCDLVCFSDFEGFIPSAFGTYYPSLQLPAFYFVPLQDVIGNTPDIYQQTDLPPTGTGKNKFVRFVRLSDKSDNQECLRIPLTQTIMPGCTVKVKYRASTHEYIGVFPASGRRIEIYGLSAPPCTANQTAPPETWDNIGSDYDFCPGVKAYRMDQNNNLLVDMDAILQFNNTKKLDFQTHEFTYIHPQGSLPISDLFVWGTFTKQMPLPLQVESMDFYIDDFIVTSNCNTQLTITPRIINQCSGQQGVKIEYQLCLEGTGTTPVQIGLQALVKPPINTSFPFTYDASGGFNANGLATVTLTPGSGCNGGNNTATITLSLNIPASVSPGTMADIELLYTGNGLCVNPTNGGGITNVVIQDCLLSSGNCVCPQGSNIIPIGNNSTSINRASQLPALATPANQPLTNHCIAVNGQLIWDIQRTVVSTDFIMNKGAEIVVQNGKKLTLQNCKLEGCQHMWKGVRLENGATLVAEQNTEFYDAQWGIKSEAGSNLTLVDCKFKRCFTAVYSPGPKSGLGNANITAFSGNQFLYEGPLKTPYGTSSPTDPNPQIPAPGTRSFTGVLLSNTGSFVMGANNVFDGLRNGIVAQRSNFSIKNAQFKNFVTEPAGQSGIYALDNFAVHTVNSFSSTIKNCNFENFERGIYAEASSLVAENNTMSAYSNAGAYGAPGYGIRVVRPSGREIWIRNNPNITAMHAGIQVNGSPFLMHITGNTVDLYPGQSSMNAKPRTCIMVDNVTGKYKSITNNTTLNTTPSSKLRGIHLNACGFVTVANNTIHDKQVGILSTGCNNIYFYNNTVEPHPSTGPSSKHVNGFMAENSTDYYCENTTRSHTQYGFYFAGACTPTYLQCSDIGNASRGLYLWADNDPNPATHKTTVIGTQIQRNNQWVGSYSGGVGAFHAEGFFQARILDSKFEEPIIPSFQTQYALNNPNVPPVQWFESNNLPPFNCNSCQTPPPPFGTPHDRDGDGLGSDDRYTARGEHIGDIFNWMAQQRLYERLNRYPALAALDGDVATFYANAPNQPIGQYYRTRQGVQQILYREAYVQALLEVIYSDLRIKNEELQALYLQTPSAQREQAIQDKALYLNRQYNRLLGHENWIATQRQNEATGQLVQNAVSAVPNAAAQNEKNLNNLFLANRLWEGSTPNSTVLSDVKAIADQCPHAGGLSVYTARAIYRGFVPDAFWDVEENCSLVTPRIGESQKVFMPEIQVMPNPAYDHIYLQYLSESEEWDGNFVLYDLMGRIVLTQRVLLNAKTTVIHTVDLPSGIYTYQLKGRDKMPQSGKIIIKH